MIGHSGSSRTAAIASGRHSAALHQKRLGRPLRLAFLDERGDSVDDAGKVRVVVDRWLIDHQSADG